MKVLSPVGEQKRREVTVSLSPRPATLSGEVVGIVDDGVAKEYFKRIEELLNETVKPAKIIRRVKPHFSRPSPQELLDEIAKVCTAVIVGVGI